MSLPEKSRKVVVCGGGVVGVSIAYYLSTVASSTLDILLVERESIAYGASGKAGGFLALDWCDGSKVEKLARKSFNLHAELAKKLNGTERYGYRPLDTLAVTASLKGFSQKVSPISWLDKSEIQSTSILGDKKTTAQVHPFHFTSTLWQEAEKHGAKLQTGSVEGLNYDESGKAVGVVVDGVSINADTIVLAMGPWTKYCSEWIPFDIPIDGERAHSIVMEPKKPISGHALFLALSDGTDPEIYPRPDGTVYMCGASDNVPLPEDPADIVPNHEACLRLKERADLLSTVLGEATVRKEQACYLPQPRHQVPMIGAVPGVENLFMAAGHSCWGILNAPATGLAVSELLLKGKSTSVDISQFDPAKFLRSKTSSQ